jgi:uncharacterized protein YihD (DUF1040 family)
MQLDKNMLNHLTNMNDDQLIALIQKIATESGVDPAMLGITPSNLQSIRQALGSANQADLQHLNLIYEEYQKGKKKR